MTHRLDVVVATTDVTLAIDQSPAPDATGKIVLKDSTFARVELKGQGAQLAGGLISPCTTWSVLERIGSSDSGSDGRRCAVLPLVSG